MIFNEFPFSNNHEMNLDWIISEIKRVVKEWQDMIITWEELKELVTNFLETVHVDIEKEVGKKLEEMKKDGTLADLIAKNLDLIRAVNTVADMISSKTLSEGQIVITKGYYEIGDRGNAVYLISKTQSDTGVYEKLDSKLFANMIYGSEIEIEALGVKSNVVRNYAPVSGNGAKFNKALELCKASDRNQHKFKLIGQGNYYTDETLDFGGSPSRRLSVDTFSFDFSTATIFSDMKLESLISIRSVQQIDFNFGYLKAEKAYSAVKMYSYERYDWSQYVWFSCLNATAKTYSVLVENNAEGGWFNEVHFTKGLYPQGFYVNCPNERDEVFVTNKLSGFYFSDLSCEGASDTWFRFRNTHDVYIKNVRTRDVTKHFITTHGICAYIELTGFFKTTMFNLDNRTLQMFLYGVLNVPDGFDAKNPIFSNGYWFVDNLPLTVYQGNGNAFKAERGNFASTIMYLQGDCSKVVLPKIYSDYIGINRITLYCASGSTGIVKDSYGKTVVNCSSYQDKTFEVQFAGSSWWVVS